MNYQSKIWIITRSLNPATVAILAASAIWLSGCLDGRSAIKNGDELFRTIEIEGCEYIITENGVRSHSSYAMAITHKGNCKNPIHHWSGGKHD